MKAEEHTLLHVIHLQEQLNDALKNIKINSYMFHKPLISSASATKREEACMANIPIKLANDATDA